MKVPLIILLKITFTLWICFKLYLKVIFKTLLLNNVIGSRTNSFVLLVPWESSVHEISVLKCSGCSQKAFANPFWMPVVSVHTYFFINKTLLNELIGNLKAIFKSLQMIWTILGFSLIVLDQVKVLHILESCILELLRKYITAASTKYLWIYYKTCMKF